MRRHALDQIAERGIGRGWVERAALRPDWTEPDPRPGVTRLFGAVPEFGGRVLAADRDDGRHVLTVHFDRGAGRRRSRHEG